VHPPAGRPDAASGLGGSGRVNVKRLPWPGALSTHRGGRADLVELIEDRFLILGGDADTVVGDADLNLAAAADRAEIDAPVPGKNVKALLTSCS
jgi:hypothetical protein